MAAADLSWRRLGPHALQGAICATCSRSGSPGSREARTTRGRRRIRGRNERRRPAWRVAALRARRACRGEPATAGASDPRPGVSYRSPNYAPQSYRDRVYQERGRWIVRVTLGPKALAEDPAFQPAPTTTPPTSAAPCSAPTSPRGFGAAKVSVGLGAYVHPRCRRRRRGEAAGQGAGDHRRRVLVGRRRAKADRRTRPSRSRSGSWASGGRREELGAAVPRPRQQAQRQRRAPRTTIGFAWRNATSYPGSPGNVPIVAFTLDDAERVMRALPQRASRGTRRRLREAQRQRILGLAVFPLRIVTVNPLPAWLRLPRMGRRRRRAYLYPEEDRRLLGCALRSRFAGESSTASSAREAMPRVHRGCQVHARRRRPGYR